MTELVNKFNYKYEVSAVNINPIHFIGLVPFNTRENAVDFIWFINFSTNNCRERYK